MLDEPQLDPMGALIAEARNDADVGLLVGNRVRGYEPKPATDADRGDARGPGEYVPFVIISALSVPPHPRVPVTFAEYALNAYGTTPQNAWAVWGALVKAFHAVRTRVKGNGLGIYQSLVVSGGEQDRDPDTSQPVVRGVVRVIATTLAVETVGS